MVKYNRQELIPSRGTEGRCWEFSVVSQSKRWMDGGMDVRVSVAAPPLEGADGNTNPAHHVIRDYMTSTDLFLMCVEAEEYSE